MFLVRFFQSKETVSSEIVKSAIPALSLRIYFFGAHRRAKKGKRTESQHFSHQKTNQKSNSVQGILGMHAMLQKKKKKKKKSLK